MRYTVVLIFFLTLSFHLKAEKTEEFADDFKISLITCSPGDEIYSLFGHTAIRVKSTKSSIDIIYNYGIFDFNTDLFIWRFALGQTDYQLGRVPFEHFAYEYVLTNRTVWEQELLLNDIEKKTLIELLEDNYKPENRVYRYNFLHDNCATRPLEIIKRAATTPITLEPINEQQTFRKLIHKYSANHPWSKFGMDMCLGSEADKPITTLQECFVPIELMNILSNSAYKSGNNIVKETEIIIPSTVEIEQRPLAMLTPFALFTFLFIIVIGISAYQLKHKLILNGLDIVIFATYGLAGLVLLFLAVISEHPAMSPNYLLIVFHPIHLLIAPILALKGRKTVKKQYHCINFGVLTVFILISWLLPQSFNLAILPLTGILWLRSLTYYYITRELK